MKLYHRILLLGLFAALPALASSDSHEAAPVKLAANADEAVLNLFKLLPDHSRVAGKCLECHEAQYRALNESIHGKAGLLKNFPAGTLCLTCHEKNHFVMDSLKVQNFKLQQMIQSEVKEVTCMRCHADPTLAAKYNFPPHVPSDFEHSVHYRKAMLGERRAPLCVDCHGNHSILRVDHPNSPVRGQAKVQTCAKCHVGANAWFAESFDHTPVTTETKPIDYWVMFAFKVLTLGTFLALGLYVLLDFASILRLWLTPAAKRAHGGHHDSEGEPVYVPRLNLVTRIQHFLMLFSVISLVITGWPLLAPTSPISQALMHALGGPRSLGILHRIAGFIMIGDILWHVVYLLMLFRRGHVWHPMFPMPRDITDLWEMILYFFGVRTEKPKFAEFAFHEKFDYWAVFWGCAMMGVSGLIMTFPVWATKVVPGISIRLAHIIHADEALLAAMVLFIWHFYNVHLKPGIFPMNWAWITGRMKKEHYEEEHAGHVEKLKKEGRWPPKDF